MDGPARPLRWRLVGRKQGGLRGQHRYTEPTNTQHQDMADPMSDKLHLTPEDQFPEDLETVPDHELQVLDSQVQRQLDHEVVVDGEPNPETEFRHYELDEEFNDRDKR
jgi:hypothetical protein